MFAPPTAIYTHGPGLSKYYFYAIPRSLLDIVNRCKSHMPMIYLTPPAAAIICMIWHKNTVHAYCKPSLYLLSNYSFLPNNKNCIWVFELLSSIMFVYFMLLVKKEVMHKYFEECFHVLICCLIRLCKLHWHENPYPCLKRMFRRRNVSLKDNKHFPQKVEFFLMTTSFTFSRGQ